MKKIKILWVDDEIDLLKPHIIFLEQKNYDITTTTNGTDAIELVTNNLFDIVFLDENMPGLTGLETLDQIKQIKTNLPVVMITKSEEEYIMEEAIGSKIADYLIKPVNPNQILLSLKKNLDNSRLISETTTSKYQQQFRKISLDLSMINSYQDWVTIYKNLIHWELELGHINNSGMLEILKSQKSEANTLFFKFIKKNYESLLKSDKKNKPTFSNTLFKEKIIPELDDEKGVLWLLIDNLRYDQYRVIEPFINKHYKKTEEEAYMSILPTSTQYSRNAIFSGLMPYEISQIYPKWWKNDNEKGSKNQFEGELLNAQIKRLNLNIKHNYHKITSYREGNDLANNFNSNKDNDLTVVVFNFVDMLSHAKTEIEVIKELAIDDKAYRSLTASWFKNSPLYEIIKKAQQLGKKLIVTTDHGTINCKTPSKVIGNKNISTNLRYKTGDTLTYNNKDVYAVANPEDILLPSVSFKSPFIFAKEDVFFAYPNNYNHFVRYFKNTYQQGGISLEEMIVPFAVYNPK